MIAPRGGVPAGLTVGEWRARESRHRREVGVERGLALGLHGGVVVDLHHALVGVTLKRLWPLWDDGARASTSTASTRPAKAPARG